MQGIYISYNRPRSKKQIKEQAATDPSKIQIEATSVFGNEYDGPATEMPIGTQVTFVGPDPHTKRDFYGTIKRTAKGLVVS
jgi:hypothetical protein